MPREIVTLVVTNWAFSLGGEHFTGNLMGSDENGNYKSIEVKYKLSAKDALKLNKKDCTRGYSHHKPGEMSDRFWTQKELERAAIKVYKKHFPNAAALNTGSYATCDPQRVLDGPEWFVQEANKLYEEREACGGYEGDYKKAIKLYKDYQKLERKLTKES